MARLELGSKGWIAPLRDGPLLVFGDATRGAAKWAAAVAVLGDRRSAGATYVDLRLPERPAAGGVPLAVHHSLTLDLRMRVLKRLR